MLGLAVAGAGGGVMLPDEPELASVADGVLQPVIAIPAVPGAPAKRVRRSTAPPSGLIFILCGVGRAQAWPRPRSRARIAASVRLATLSLVKIDDVLLFTVFSESPRRAAMAELDRPCASNRSTSCSRGVS